MLLCPLEVGKDYKVSLKLASEYIGPNLHDIRLYFSEQVKFADDCIGDSAQQMAKDLKAGEILLLENLRFYKEEEKGDEQFAQKQASLGDVYVNDAFGTAHRAHAIQRQ